MLSENLGNEKEVSDSESESYSSGGHRNHSFHNGLSRVYHNDGSTLKSTDPVSVSP